MMAPHLAPQRWEPPWTRKLASAAEPKRHTRDASTLFPVPNRSAWLRSRGISRAYSPRTMTVRLVGHVQNRLLWCVGAGRVSESRQLREIGRCITRAIGPGDYRRDDQPLPAAMAAQAP